VPPGDPAALAAAISALAADPRRRGAMAGQGRAYVQRFFDRDDLARQYRKILDNPTGAAEPDAASEDGPPCG
jgi:glycosyltransferase involved in cell wall biosynthesis